MAYSGKYVPKNREKYRGDSSKIVFRSLLERRFMLFCDTHPSVIEWNYEKVVIPYTCITDNRLHRYIVDFWVKVRKADGSVEEMLVEIKPHKKTMEPDPQIRKTKRYIRECLDYGKNKSKWEAAEKYCDRRKIKFRIITEKDLR